MDRFQQFNAGAQRVLTLAQDEAQRFNHNYIGTEHLLLGLVREGEGVAARVLESMDADLAKVRIAVEFIIGRGDRPVVSEVGLTPRAKRVIELAIDEARRLGHNYIGTEHLLLGIVREGEGIAAGVLESLGVELDGARRGVIAELSKRGISTETADIATTQLWPPARRYQRFSDWTDHARYALLTSQRLSEERGQRVIGPQHLLLGLLEAPEGSASVALALLGVRAEAVREAVESRVADLILDPTIEAGLTPESRLILDAAEGAARALDAVEVDATHLMLALTESDDVGELLRELAVTSERLRLVLGSN